MENFVQIRVDKHLYGIIGLTVMAETGITGDLTHVRDVAEIGQCGVMGTPAVVINEEVRAVGHVPNRAKLKDWLRQASENKQA